MAETNTRVSLIDHMTAQFKAQEKLNVARYDALKQQISAGTKAHNQRLDAHNQKLDAHARAEMERQDAHAKLDAQRWKSHEKTHQRERGIGSVLMAVGSVIAAAVGSRLPK